jgi:Galactose oxidase, central domain
MWRGRLSLGGLHAFFRPPIAGKLPQVKGKSMHRSIGLTDTTSSGRTWRVTWPNNNKAIGTRLPALIAGFLPVVSILTRRIAFLLLFVVAGLMLVRPCVGAPFQFEETGSLATARDDHTATLLPNGKVLVAGGSNNNGVNFASAELYDPATGTWTKTGSLTAGRTRHTATLLPNGKVLVAGGYDVFGNPFASAELYDPASGTWTETGSLATRRSLHTATLLPNGKVLVAGGYGLFGDHYLTSAELYDPASGTWTATGSLNMARYNHTATLLPNGKVLVAGGLAGGYLASAELYDVGLGFSSDWQPKIRRLKLGGKRLLLAGSLFQGVSQASGGNTQVHQAITRSCSYAASITTRLSLPRSIRPMAGRTQASLLCL